MSEHSFAECTTEIDSYDIPSINLTETNSLCTKNESPSLLTASYLTSV